MTILFYLKPNNYSFPPSGVPNDYGPFGAPRKLSDKEIKRRRQKRERDEELVIVSVLEWLRKL